MKTQTEKPFDRKHTFFNQALDSSNLNVSDRKRQLGEAKEGSGIKSRAAIIKQLRSIQLSNRNLIIQIKQLGSVQEQHSFFGVLEAGEGVMYETHQAHVLHVLLGQTARESKQQKVINR